MADKYSDRDAAHAVFGLGETRPQGAPESEPGGAPQTSMHPGMSGSGRGLAWLVGVLTVITLANLAFAIYWHYESSETMSQQATLATRRLDSNDTAYAELRGQFQVMREKLGFTQQELARARQLAGNIQEQQQQAVTQLNQAISTKASTEDLNKVQADANSKITGLSGDLAGTKKEFADALTGTKGELTGAIARTHDELVDLAHRSDRDYFEFNLARKHARQKLGSVLLELAKTNPKKNQYTVELYYDDKRSERTHAINEPVLFYVQGAANALELVVNKLGHDSISGYVSAPKGFFSNVPNVLTARPTS